MHGWLDLIGNDKLDGGRFKRILRIEPDHEVEDFILEITGAISDTQELERGGGGGARARGVRGEEARWIAACKFGVGKKTSK